MFSLNISGIVSYAETGSFDRALDCLAGSFSNAGSKRMSAEIGCFTYQVLRFYEIGCFIISFSHLFVSVAKFGGHETVPFKTY